MKPFAWVAAPLVLLASPLAAQTAPTPTTPAARLNLDTPVETIVGDAAGKKVLDADLPGLTTNDKYEMFKGMSLNQLASFAPDKMTPERLAKVKGDLAAIK